MPTTPVMETLTETMKTAHAARSTVKLKMDYNIAHTNHHYDHNLNARIYRFLREWDEWK